MDGILNFNEALDIPLLDQVVNTFYTGSGEQQKQAQVVLTQFQAHPDSWQRADQILQNSNNPQSKFIALGILDKLITSKWKILPKEQRIGIRNFIAGMIISLCTSGNADKNLIKKSDLTLVQILKQDWPAEWPEFINEIIQSSQSSEAVCQNNLTILTLLSEEIFDFSSEQMTQAKAMKLKTALTNEFKQIFNLCFNVLSGDASKDSLIKTALACLLRYIQWIPPSFIFETDIINLLSKNFLTLESTRSLSLKCLTEISSLDLSSVIGNIDVQNILSNYFKQSLTSINSFMPPNTNLKEIYLTSNNSTQAFLHDFAMFLTTYLSNHRVLLEERGLSFPEEKEMNLTAHSYLIDLSRINERELFKICLDYWNSFSKDLFDDMQSQINNSATNSSNTLMKLKNMEFQVSSQQGAPDPQYLMQYPLKKHIYEDLCASLRIIIIENMAKPEEVLIVENDEGEIVREFVKESDTIQLYKSEKQALVYLTHLNVSNTENIMVNKLSNQLNGSEWSWHNINTLCWAIGSISGAMSASFEKSFIVTVIRDLLVLTEQKRGKDNKAVVASNIMYVVGQYPRFLRAHWKFLKTVIAKLFEFMHEKHEGVQDMACDTFFKIVEKCKRHFITIQDKESEPYLMNIITNISDHICDLETQQVHSFYRTCGIMIADENNESQRELYLQKLMIFPNEAWTQICQLCLSDPNMLTNTETAAIVSNIVKTNLAACSSLGTFFKSQILYVHSDMFKMYTIVSKLINDAVAKDGDIATKTPKVRALRSIKKDILKLMEAYISKANDIQQNIAILINPLLQTVLQDYFQNVPDAKDAEVLKCMATVVKKVGGSIPDGVILILQSVFECTLDMITKDLTNYPEHRVEFYNLLKQINSKCFNALLQLPPAAFKLFIDSIFWAFKHNNRDIEVCGLDIALELIEHILKLPQNNEFVINFYQQYYFTFISEIFAVMTDSDHKSGFSNQAAVLMKLIAIVENGVIKTSIVAAGPESMEGASNHDYLYAYMGNMLTNALPNLTTEQIISFLQSLVKQCNSPKVFNGLLRDFLVQIKEYGGDPADYLYVEEVEIEKQKKQQAEMMNAARVGGLVKPSEFED
ncbi:probable Exportin-1 [Hanseniaspora guilliermondii]|uniref:Exportin-1 n=1 Tax=Hanseniaspora guilliermondii TaxID=56406 RepID=A0A1L0ATH3_9ASCO|nr:probable Exportin-1 [Hanseniaspora guilliermondii]